MSWFFYALLAAVAFSFAAIFQKLASVGRPETSAFEILILSGLAAIAIGAAGFFWKKEHWTIPELPNYGWGVAAGLALALGSLAIFMAFKAGGTAGQVQPVVNANSLGAALLGLIFLGEAARLAGIAAWAKLFGGIGLIAGGAWLLALL